MVIQQAEKKYQLFKVQKDMKKIFSSAAVAIAFISQAQNPLAIPQAVSGTNFSLTIHDTSKVFYSGFTTNTFGVNADYLGPTLILNQGDSVSINVTNMLMDTTTIHWHGLHVAPSNDGGPHTTIAPGTTWNPKFKVRDHASTFWYHPHLHMMTNHHATKGAAGMIIVQDSAEAALALPRTYGVDDFPVVIQSKAFDATKQITVDNAYDSVMMVNGTLNPFLQAPAQVVRLRLLNASSERVYNLGFGGNISFYQIATDGGLLDSSVALTRLLLAPGERAQILVDLTLLQGQTINLMSYAAELPTGIYGASNPAAMGNGTITGYSTNILNGSNFTILQLQVVAPTSNPVTSVPPALIPNNPYSLALSNITRTISFSPVVMGPNQALNGPFWFNNQSFDMDVVNYTIPRDNIEIWQLTNNTAIAHPFHIHDVQFYIIDMNGSGPPINLQGRKDVVLVRSQQTVSFVTKFEDFCDTVPYMYHCHMLTHEDDGMMGQFTVSCPAVGINEQVIEKSELEIYPNPAHSEIVITAEKGTAIVIYSSYGEKVRSLKSEGKQTISISDLAAGIYFIRANGATASFIRY